MTDATAAATGNLLMGVGAAYTESNRRSGGGNISLGLNTNTSFGGVLSEMFGGSEIGGMISALFSSGGSGSSRVSEEGGGLVLAAHSAFKSTATSIHYGADAGAALAMGAIQFGAAYGGAALGGSGIIGGAVSGGINSLAGGFRIGANGGLDYKMGKGDWGNMALSVGFGGAGGAAGKVDGLTGAALGTTNSFIQGGVGFSDDGSWNTTFNWQGATVSGTSSALNQGMGAYGMSDSATFASGVSTALINSAFNGTNAFAEYNTVAASKNGWSDLGNMAGRSNTGKSLFNKTVGAIGSGLSYAWNKTSDAVNNTASEAGKLLSAMGAWASRSGRGIGNSYMEGYSSTRETSSAGSGGRSRGGGQIGYREDPLSGLVDMLTGGKSSGGGSASTLSIGGMLSSALGLEYASGLVSGIYHGIGNVAQDAWYGAGDLIKKGASATWTSIEKAMKHTFTADAELSVEELKTIQEKMLELHADGKLTKEEMQSFLEEYIDRSDFDKLVFDDENGSFALQSKSHRFLGIFGNRTERLEFFQRDGQDTAFNYIRNESNFWDHFMSSDRTFINGTELENGDAFVRGLSGSLSVIEKEDFKIEFEKYAAEGKTFHFTQNGMNTNGLWLVGMDERSQPVLANDYAAGLDGSIGVFNQTNRLFGAIPLGDIFNYTTGNEKAISTWETIIKSGVLDNGGSVVAHSQGAQIVAAAFENVAAGLTPKGRENFKTNIDLYFIGGAHRTVPDQYVHHVYDIRNTGMFEPVSAVAAVRDYHADNYTLVTESEGGWKSEYPILQNKNDPLSYLPLSDSPRGSYIGLQFSTQINGYQSSWNGEPSVSSHSSGDYIKALQFLRGNGTMGYYPY